MALALPNIRVKFYDTDGSVLASGTVVTTTAGTSTAIETWANQDESTSNGTTVTLDSQGEAQIWLRDDKSYKFVVKDSAGTPVHTIDNIHGIQGANLILISGSSIQDIDNNEWLKFTKTSSAINEFTITNAAAGSEPNIAATGGDPDINVEVTPKGTGDLDLTVGAILENKGADITAATTTDLSTASGNYLDIAGTTTITGLGTVKAGTRIICNFTGSLTLTHHATSLILPTEANISTATGDTATFVSLGSGNWKCVNYNLQSGDTVSGTGVSAASQAEEEAGSSTVVYTSPGKQQFHPAVAKGWLKFNGSGTIAIDVSYNVTSIADNGVGEYTVTWATDFSGTEYSVVGLGNPVLAFGFPENQLAGSVFVENVSITGGGINVDGADIAIAAFGDHA